MNHRSFLNISLSLSLSVSCFQFAEKFQEVKDAAKLARDKSQEKVETLSNHSQVNDLSLPPDALIHFNTAVENQQITHNNGLILFGSSVRWFYVYFICAPHVADSMDDVSGTKQFSKEQMFNIFRLPAETIHNYESFTHLQHVNKGLKFETIPL